MLYVAAHKMAEWNVKASLLEAGTPCDEDVLAMAHVQKIDPGANYFRPRMTAHEALEAQWSEWNAHPGKGIVSTDAIDAAVLTNKALIYYSCCTDRALDLLCDEVERKANKIEAQRLATLREMGADEEIENFVKRIFLSVMEHEPDKVTEENAPQYDRWMWTVVLNDDKYSDLRALWGKKIGKEIHHTIWTPTIYGSFKDEWIYGFGTIGWAVGNVYFGREPTRVIRFAKYLNNDRKVGV